MSTLEKAIEIAKYAHRNQVDKTGAPYFGHLYRVMKRGENETEKISGILHDIVEDTDWTFEALENEGFTKEVIDVLKLVTKTSEDEDYDAFIERVSTNPIAVKVELNDLRDNMDITRLDVITDKDAVRLNKYLKAYKILVNI